MDILNGIDLTLAAGEILTVAGSNGAGKSTLAKAIVGLLPRLTGQILLRDRDITALPTVQRARSGIGYVPQVANVFPSLTVLENLEVVEGVPDRHARIAELFAMFPALAKRRRARAGSLSGGSGSTRICARARHPPGRRRAGRTDGGAVAGAGGGLLQPHRAPGAGRHGGASDRAAGAPGFGDFRARRDPGWRRVALAGDAGALLEDERAIRLYLGHE